MSFSERSRDSIYLFYVWSVALLCCSAPMLLLALVFLGFTPKENVWTETFYSLVAILQGFLWIAWGYVYYRAEVRRDLNIISF